MKHRILYTTVMVLSMAVFLTACGQNVTFKELESEEQAYMEEANEKMYKEIISPEITTQKDVVFKTFEKESEVQELKLDICMPTDEADCLRPAILLVHGGGLTTGDKANAGIMKSMAEDFAKMGYVTFNANYRLGTSATQEVLENGMEDVESAVKWIQQNAQEYHVDSSRIVLLGYSAGSILVTNLCYSDNCDDEVRESIVGVVSISGGNWYYPMTQKEVPPCLLLHGTNDTTVPYENSERFYAIVSKQNEDSRFYSLEGLNHTLTTRYDEIRNQIAMFMYEQVTGNEVVIDMKSEVSVEYQGVLSRMENQPEYRVKPLKVTLDGDLGEWEGFEKIELNQIKDVGDSMPDAEDFSGSVMLGWNPDVPTMLYIAARIQDNTSKNDVSADGKWYNDDCIEIILDVSQNNNAEQLLKWVVGADGKDLSVLANSDNTTCAVQSNGTLSTYEIGIDISKLPTGTLQSLKEVVLSPQYKFGFSIGYNDCENGIREHQIGWTAGRSNDRTCMGNLVFEE